MYVKHMRIVGGPLVGIAALVMVQACGSAKEPSATSDARTVTPDVRAYEAAASKLIAELGEPGSKSDLPRASDPIFTQFSDQATALTSVLGTDHYPVSMQTFDALCLPAARVLTSYAMAGIDKAVPKDGSEAAKQEAVAQLQASNMTKYFDQLFPTLVFSAHCGALHSPEAAKFASGLSPAQLTDVRKAGIRQFRDGMFNSADGLLTIASDPGLDDARRIKVLKTLASDGERMVPSLSLDARQKLAITLNGFRSGLLGDAKQYGDAFAAELQSKECDVICAM